MDKEKIIESAIRVGLPLNKQEKFVQFFMQRFPKESNEITSYVDEWAERFKEYDPEIFMDDESKDLYRSL